MWRAENIGLISPQLWTFFDKMENTNITLYICSCLCPRGSLGHLQTIHKGKHIHSITDCSDVGHNRLNKGISDTDNLTQNPVHMEYHQAVFKVNSLIIL